MKTTVYIDREAVEEAMRLAGSRKMTEVINAALREFIRRRRMERLAERLGAEDLTLTLDDLAELRRDD
ncbi:MAG: type II toxin-antitoxin system VapB family antitoxin [Bacillota bacterium]|nr:type II toxin-antitoxin system VapB family antitoxin [Bacillota bacterium]